MTEQPRLGALLASMLKIGTIGFGGGSALIPVMEKELVHDRRFLTEPVFTLHTVIANITPGALPVKLGALAGGRTRGPLAALLCALAVALPGTVGTVALIAAFNILGDEVVRYVEYAAVGIAAFIIVLLGLYITKVIAGGGRRRPVYLIIMVVSWLLTGVNGLVRLVGHLIGQPLDAQLPTLSAVGLIVAALVAIGVVSLIHRNPGVDRDLTMAQPTPQIGPKLQAMGIFAGLTVVAIGIGLAVSGGDGLRLLSLVAFSTVTSFGGGEAYVGVADGFFVAGGLVSSQVFYGQLVPVANALPGPILVKIATGVGYAYGTALGGPALGMVFALLAFCTSIGACCAVVIAVITGWTKAANSAFMVNLGRYILPVICGLLLTTSVSMINANVHIGQSAAVAAPLVAWGTIAAVGLMWFLHWRFRTHDLILLAAAGAASLGLLAVA